MTTNPEPFWKQLPCEFLGRCQTCLDNVYLNSEPCCLGYGLGQPINGDECAIRRAQKEYQHDH